MGEGRSDNKQTLIEAGTAFKGSLSSDCPIVVRGRVEGELAGPSLTVSSTGSVSGNVKVDELHSDGELSGEYDANVVKLAGTVKNNTVIRAKKLEVKLSPEKGKMEVVFGECELDVGDMPSKEDAVAAAESAAAPAATSEEDSETSDDETAEAGSKNRRNRGNNKQKESVPPPA